MFLQISWSLLGNIIYAAGQWAVLIILAKMTTPNILGQFAFGLAITAPIIMFGNMRLRLIQSSDDSNRYQFHDYFTLRLITTGVAMVCLIAIPIFGNYSNEMTKVIIIIGIAKAIESFSDIIFGYFQKYELLKYIGISLTIKGIISILFVLVLTYIYKNAIAAATGLVIAWGLMFIFFDFKKARSLEDRSSTFKIWSLNKTSTIFIEAIPLGFVALLGSLSFNIPKYFIEHLKGESSLGIYAAIGYLSVAVMLIAASIGTPTLKKIASYYTNHDIIRFNSLYLFLVIVAFLIGSLTIIISITIGSELLGFIYGYEYSEYADLLTLFFVATIFNMIALYQWYILTAIKVYREQVLIYLISIAIVVIICRSLIPTLGLYGAVIAEIVGMLTHVVINTILIKDKVAKMSNI